MVSPTSTVNVSACRQHRTSGTFLRAGPGAVAGKATTRDSASAFLATKRWDGGSVEGENLNVRHNEVEGGEDEVRADGQPCTLAARFAADNTQTLVFGIDEDHGIDTGQRAIFPQFGYLIVGCGRRREHLEDDAGIAEESGVWVS